MTHPQIDTIDSAAPQGGFAEEATLAALRLEAFAGEVGQRVNALLDNDALPYAIAAGTLVLAGTAITAVGRTGQKLLN
jgi:hypothetical protein